MTEDAKPKLGVLRRIWPWLVGLALLVFVIARVPFDAFSDAIQHGPHLRLAAVNSMIAVAVLCSDSTSTWIGLIALRMRRPFKDVMVLRGAAFALFVVNYALGQGAFGYYLHRTGEKPLRATGATLFLIGTNLATLLVLTSIAWAVGDLTLPMPRLTATLGIGCGALALYLVVIAMAPGFVAKRELFAPLFDAGTRGHLLAMLGRVPHVIVIVIAQWAAVRAWGINVPFVTGMLITPIVVIATVLPISPAGLGTAQAAFAYFFSSFATGVTEHERTAHVVAFGIVHFIYGVAASLLVGLICLPIARRRGALRADT